MAKAAIAGFQKVMKKCPYCKTEGPKELVAGPKRTSWIIFIILLLFTAGIGLILIPLWRRTSLEALCPNCNKSFHPGSF